MFFWKGMLERLSRFWFWAPPPALHRNPFSPSPRLAKAGKVCTGRAGAVATTRPAARSSHLRAVRDGLGYGSHRQGRENGRLVDTVLTRPKPRIHIKTLHSPESRASIGAGSRNRTGTPVRARDFESRASTSSAIPARGAQLSAIRSPRATGIDGVRRYNARHAN